MIDIQKLAHEFAFLREKIREVSKFINSNEHAEAAFLLGGLHSICHNHAVTISQLIPPKPVAPEAPQDEQPAV